MAKSRGLRSGPLPDRQPLRHQAPPPAERVPPFILVREIAGDVLLTPYPRNAMTPEATVLVKAVVHSLKRDLPAGCYWVDPSDGRATPATLAVPQLRRRLEDCASYNVRMP
jgi:hypothetical protein